MFGRMGFGGVGEGEAAGCVYLDRNLLIGIMMFSFAGFCFSLNTTGYIGTQSVWFEYLPDW